MKRLTPAVVLAFFYLTPFLSKSQQASNPTLEKVNTKITKLQRDLAEVSKSINAIQADKKILEQAKADGSWIKWNESKANLLNEISEWTSIRNSIVSGTKNGTNLQKVKITWAEFNALPEVNQKAILSEPERFEIIEQ